MYIEQFVNYFADYDKLIIYVDDGFDFDGNYIIVNPICVCKIKQNKKTYINYKCLYKFIGKVDLLLPFYMFRHTNTDNFKIEVKDGECNVFNLVYDDERIVDVYSRMFNKYRNLG